MARLRIKWGRVTALLTVVALTAIIAAWQSRDRDPTVAGVGWRHAACGLPHRWVELAARGWYDTPEGSSDVIVFRDPPANHSGPQEVLQSIPLAFYGPGLVPAGEVEVDREITLADVAATTARMVGLEGFETPDGAPIEEVLPDDPPRLIVTVVMDGGGLNTLARWPASHPKVDRVLSEGASIKDAKVGSSPSVTTAVHATLSTGAFPDKHGITGLLQRDDTGRIVPAFSLTETSRQSRVHPRNLKLPTVGDLWDLQNDNEAEVGYIASFNYPLGMLSHGAAYPGGDKDIAVIGAGRKWETTEEFYALPSYVREMSGMGRLIQQLDEDDGQDDDKWLGSEQAFTRLDALPIYPRWQNQALLAMLEQEGYGDDEVADLMYVNYKPMDMSAHFWSITAPQMKAAVESVDAAVGDLIAWLEVNLPQQYVLVLTADHGGIPLRTDSFPYDAETLRLKAESNLDKVDNENGIFEELTPTAYYVDAAELRENDLTAEDVADYLLDLPIRDAVPPDREVSPDFDGDLDGPLFQAVVPAGRLDEVLRCTRGNR